MWAPLEVGSLSDQHVGGREGLQGEVTGQTGGRLRVLNTLWRGSYLICREMTGVSEGNRDTASVSCVLWPPCVQSLGPGTCQGMCCV